MAFYHSKTHQYFLKIFFCIVLCFLFFGSSLSSRAQQYQSANYNRIQQAIASQEENIKSSEEQGLNILKEIQRLDNDLKVGQAKLVFLQERLMRQENHIQIKEREISKIQREKDNIASHVGNRLRSFYQMDEISIINALFSAQTLPDLINLQEYFQAMFQYDQQILRGYSTNIFLLAGARDEILKEKDKLLDLIIAAQDQEEMLISARLERKTLLARIQTEEKLYRTALQGIQAAADKLADEMNSIRGRVIRTSKRKIARIKATKKRKPEGIESFATMKGKLPPPAQGRVIKYFGSYLDKFNTKNVSTGINIEVHEKTPVKAIYPGEVVYSGSMEIFGNIIIIDHGYDYHSLISGFESASVEKGEQVLADQTIAIMGDGTNFLSKGLHFEIRVESLPVDPLAWIESGKLTLTDEQSKYQ